MPSSLEIKMRNCFFRRMRRDGVISLPPLWGKVSGEARRAKTDGRGVTCNSRNHLPQRGEVEMLSGDSREAFRVGGLRWMPPTRNCSRCSQFRPPRVGGGDLRGTNLRTESRADPVEAAHIRPQRLGDEHRTVRLLIILQDRDKRAPNRKPGAVQRVYETGVLFALRSIACVHAAGLEVAAIRAGRNFAEHILTGQPDLDVVRLLRAEAHVAGG